MQRWMAGALLAMLAACGPAASAGGTASAAGATAASGGSRVIVDAEIEANTASNLLELVQQLRPAWLQQRSAVGGQGYPTVYLGSQPLGSVDRLREVPTHNVREVRFLNGPEASSRFGARVPFGVIQVLVDIGG
ncbi:MAG TPA: hypothetical protein VLK84_08820 [Longimicrobium sp.]|nr:hypothetical protein [Longimicrobium sp.]